MFQLLDEQVRASPPTGPIVATADFDQDGDLDLLTRDRVFLNDGNLGFTPGATTPGIAGVNLMGDPVACAGDLNGDGFPDVVTTGGWWGVTWINNGSGAFTSSASFPTAAAATAMPPYPQIQGMALGDVDGDGDLDVFVELSGYGTWFFQGPQTVQPRLLLNDGIGGWTDVTATQLPAFVAFANGVDMRDFDGDGDVDILLWRRTSQLPWGPVTYPALTLLLLNTGSGSFPGPVFVPDPGTPANVAVADFNGDGLPDVAFSSVASLSPSAPAISGPATNGITLNAGNGTFSPFVSTPQASPARVVAGSLNGGWASLIRLGQGFITVHFVLGGAIAPPSQVLPITGVGAVLSDLDLDGDPDLVVDGGNRTVIAGNDGVGMLIPIVGYTNMPATQGSYTAGDVDGDGHPDFVWATASGLAVALNDGAGSLYDAPGFFAGTSALVTSSSRMYPLDYDADGRLDVYAACTPAASNPVGTDSLYRGTTGGWALAATLTTPGRTSAVIEGDLDGDGDKDLVVGRYLAPAGASYGPAPSFVYFNLGSGSLAAPVALPIQYPTVAAVLLDEDGDGDLDIAEVAASGSPGVVVLLINNGLGSFSSGTFPTTSTWTILAGDVDLDGDTDLALDSQVFTNTGAGVFVPGPVLPVGGFGLSLFDADGDGDLDLTKASPSGPVLLTNVLGVFSVSQVFTSVTSVTVGPHADFDGDGDQDLIASGPRILTNTTRQIARGSLARIGHTASLDLYGPPGSLWVLYASAGTANFTLPTWGTVFIDPASAVLFAAGTFPASGPSSLSGFIPNNPALVGATVWWQAMIPSQHRLTNREVTTILGL